ncbi:MULTISPECIES: hypothetical protein [Leeuwenhoekiella]|uniref:hypothetical protein n=1 Tax=Leeuwenhoekiella TaxID=283735 RepID=UPI000C4C294A|nr:hypothetical protein [Leeuwenhoekiella blandensis]MBQ53225.1 hypothetical protein [Leeuwenhoekiella sp.]|tara:strand:+ start:35398 stop:36078 length:681 start_codon:yes stop_codon:yes gene_type:complete
MEWIKIIAPLLGVILGFGLSERAKIWSDKRQDKRKLKRLLFYLLELRFLFIKEFNAQKEIKEFYERAEEKLKSEFGENTKSEIEIAKPIVERIIKNNLGGNNKINLLEENIDSVIDDLAEVFPILAYELSGKHNIKERINIIDNYISDATDHFGDMPLDLKEWLKPKITDNLISDLDETIKKISEKIDKDLWQHSTNKIANMDKNEDGDMENFLNEFIEKAKEINQ